MADTIFQTNLFAPQTLSGSSLTHFDELLLQKFKNTLEIDHTLSRQLVSFQANKNRPVFRWYKFKEAFSADLVETFLDRFQIPVGSILDPFAGSGTTLFSASAKGYSGDGIELLPVAQEIITTRLIVDNLLSNKDLNRIKEWLSSKPWESETSEISLPTIKITEFAYPEETKKLIENYLNLLKNEKLNVNKVLLFALLCVLEDVSYTRKDGQYLRWDNRALRTRTGKKAFTKNVIYGFSEAIIRKIEEIINDVDNTQKINANSNAPGLVRLFSGSNLEILPNLVNNSYEAIITSPPYCNRYDYTRTYALELAILGLSDSQVIKLRQQMLSSTVENRSKKLIELNPSWKIPLTIVENQELLQSILNYLEYLKIQKELNNSGIPRMVKGYFEEMSCIIYECFRVLKPNAPLIMVNDNVRFAGISIPVDLILSNIAEEIGYKIERILVLQNGKGNSSQQMGKHGRDQLRKCVYVWRKP